MNISSLYKFIYNPNFKKTVNMGVKNIKTIDKSISASNVQNGFLNFFDKERTFPTVAISANGPWVMGVNNKFYYDAGGFGMLGFGHSHIGICKIMGSPHVTSNITMPSYCHHYFSDIFHKITNNNYSKVMCLNSGSEANTLAIRLCNIHNSTKIPVIINMKQSFHGRTELPAFVSDSSQEAYKMHLADYKNNRFNIKRYTIEPNNIEELDKTIQQIKDNNEKLEFAIMEPVMGEGNPGYSINPKYYKKLRDYTSELDSSLIIDSVQAGLRTHGVLSITEYPGFEKLNGPDIEVFSKTISGGHFPLSVIAINKRIENLIKPKIYSNSMGGNPIGVDIATHVLGEIYNPKNGLQNNINSKGDILLTKFRELKQKYNFIERVEGTGLLLAIHLDKNRIDINDVQIDLRNIGLNLIPAGANAIRFTPWFFITDDEIDLIYNILDNYFTTLLHK